MSYRTVHPPTPRASAISPLATLSTSRTQTIILAFTLALCSAYPHPRPRPVRWHPDKQVDVDDESRRSRSS